jgi:hypothetical protein
LPRKVRSDYQHGQRVASVKTSIGDAPEDGQDNQDNCFENRKVREWTSKWAASRKRKTGLWGETKTVAKTQ